jgi:diaminohydroxyphosphoribosylaminopyrimidine deaminase/5-amino-6-(5-phosphoribosylamino)uracil reductase
VHEDFAAPPEPLAITQSGADLAWSVIRAAARTAERWSQAGQQVAFALDESGQLVPVGTDDRDALIAWQPGSGWELVLPDSDPRHALIDLYLPICSATAENTVTLGHLGQSLDGFIATRSGDSQWVTGRENILHLHRLRALCDAVVVGAGTIAADDPQLTTRLVRGPNPVRVVLDPGRRLDGRYRVFNDESAETLYLCSGSLIGPEERRLGVATIVGMEMDDRESLDPAAVMQVLRARGCTRVFVEGGGVTVSQFLEANLLDRLHLAIAPVIIGDGRPAIRLPPYAALAECQRPLYRVFRMGGDVLFDCVLGSHGDHGDGERASAIPPVKRII